MARQQQQKRSQGGGRVANSEPRLQVFRDFNGVDFSHSRRFDSDVDVDTKRSDDGDQTDLQMNFMFLQNNVNVTSNKTLEVRNNIVQLCSNDSWNFTGPSCLIGSQLYLASSDGGILRYDMVNDEISYIRIASHSSTGNTWTSLDYYDNKLIALTSQNEIWVGDVNSSYVVSIMQPPVEISDPTSPITFTRKGSLEISNTPTESCPFRVEVAYTYVNMFGPTRLSATQSIYANYPVSEWNVNRYLRISGTISVTGIKAIELYYETGDAMDMLFLGRVDVRSTATTWKYDWYGYVDATSMWPIANLIAPTDNYTGGVHASRLCNIDGRMYFWGDSSNPQRLYIGGNPGNLFSISPGTGGGFVDVEPGTRQRIRYVCKYKTQSGASIVTMLCDSPNSHHEQRFNLVENSITLSNEQSMKSWQAEQVAGAVGCKSYHGAIVCEDGLYAISRYGLALTTMTMEYNAQIQTNYVSEQIKPVFTNAIDIYSRLSKASLLELDGIIYMALGAKSDQEGNLDNVLFCYDIGLKAWWTYTLDVDTPILSLIHIDWSGGREGIGIITKKKVYLLPTTSQTDDVSTPNHRFLIQTAQLSTQLPQQGWQYLSQLEFHFDYFVGNATIEVRMLDMFGRNLVMRQIIDEQNEQCDFVTRMRIDQRVMSYVIIISGTAKFRMTHFLARVYTLSNKIGQVWGFDDSIGHKTLIDVHPYFKCYNDVRDAIFT